VNQNNPEERLVMITLGAQALNVQNIVLRMPDAHNAVLDILKAMERNGCGWAGFVNDFLEEAGAGEREDPTQYPNHCGSQSCDQCDEEDDDDNTDEEVDQPEAEDADEEEPRFDLGIQYQDSDNLDDTVLGDESEG
jgi:hypothetical protein